MSDTKPESYWDQGTRDRWFFGALAFATGAIVLLFSGFLYVLMFAVVTVVVTWPVYQAMLARVGHRRPLAALLTMLVLFVLVFGPIIALIAVFVSQAAVVVQRGVAWVQTGGLTTLMTSVQADLIPQVEEYIEGLTGRDHDIARSITGPLQSGLLAVLEGVGSGVPQLIGVTASVAINLVIFLFAVITLYMEGPAVLRVVKNLSPMDDAYDDQLFSVFHQFANNMVIGSLVTAALQGLVAAIGYAIGGADNIVFLGIVTAFGAFIPLVGTALVWIPVTIYVATSQGLGWAVFVALWSLIVTGTIDNIVKPLFLRGGTNIHPLLIFLGVFGGLSWMGVPGVLVGPVIVAFFLALYTIYVRDFLQKPDDDETEDVPAPAAPAPDPGPPPAAPAAT